MQKLLEASHQLISALRNPSFLSILESIYLCCSKIIILIYYLIIYIKIMQSLNLKFEKFASLTSLKFATFCIKKSVLKFLDMFFFYYLLEFSIQIWKYEDFKIKLKKSSDFRVISLYLKKNLNCEAST